MGVEGVVVGIKLTALPLDRDPEAAGRARGVDLPGDGGSSVADPVQGLGRRTSDPCDNRFLGVFFE